MGSDPAVARLLNLVGRRLGLNAGMRRPGDVDVRIRRAMARVRHTSPAAYLAGIESGQFPLDDLVAEFTVGESHFFRHEAQLDFLARRAVPEARRRRGPAQAVRLWSAGCASGEEAYSLAIALDEAGASMEILATDVSPAALRAATRAEYRAWALRGVPDAIVRRCFLFLQAHNRWRLRDTYRAPVRFFEHNLVHDPCPSDALGLRDLDVILCRNVLIYLDAPAIQRVTAALVDALAEGGWLLTAPSDPMLQDPRLTADVADHGVVYCRRAAPASPEPVPVHAAPEIVAERPGQVQLHTAGGPQHPSAAGPHGRARTTDETLPQVTRDLAQQPLRPDLHLRHARLLLDRQRLDEAADALRRVLYLDRSTAIAHYLLGTILQRQGRCDDARRSYRRARDLASAYPATAPLPLSDGAPAGQLMAAASAELHRLGGDTRTS